MKACWIAGAAALAAVPALRAQSPVVIVPASPAGNLFGWVVSRVPSVDGDGAADIAVGAHAEDWAGNPNAGRVHLYSGVNGSLIRSINPPNGQPLGTFGYAVAGTRDANNDGKGDVLVGAIWHKNSWGVLSGRAYLFSGATGEQIRSWVSPNPEQNGAFGWAVASVPDVNSDGVDDFAISAAHETVGGVSGQGRVYLYSGATGLHLRTLVSPTPAANEAFGMSLAGAPDLNGDGAGEVIVGAPSDSTGRPGRVYAYSGRTGAFLRVIASGTPAADGCFGIAVGVCGDLNSDGKPEIVIGASKENNGDALHSGHVHIYAGGTWQLLRRINPPNPVLNGGFGYSVSCARSAAGTPLGIVLVGEPGRARAYAFPPTGAPAAYQSTIAPLGSQFGSGIAGIGNANGGATDVVVGAPYTGSARGSAFLFR